MRISRIAALALLAALLGGGALAVANHGDSGASDAGRPRPVLIIN